MEDHSTVPLPTSASVNPADIVHSTTIIEEGPRICPLCNSIVKQFFINFNEKIVMCENTECEFPFGHEELKFFKENNEVGIDEELISVGRGSLANGSILTAAEWMDIDKINRAYDSEDTQSDYKAYTLRNPISTKEKETQKQITKNIQRIKEINAQLCADQEEEVLGICNEKWIRTLMNYQERSGVQLLKHPEMNKLKRKKPEIGLGELKIDIDSKSNSMSSIKIEITNIKNANP